MKNGTISQCPSADKKDHNRPDLIAFDGVADVNEQFSQPSCHLRRDDKLGLRLESAEDILAESRWRGNLL